MKWKGKEKEKELQLVSSPVGIDNRLCLDVVNSSSSSLPVTWLCHHADLLLFDRSERNMKLCGEAASEICTERRKKRAGDQDIGLGKFTPREHGSPER